MRPLSRRNLLRALGGGAVAGGTYYGYEELTEGDRQGAHEMMQYASDSGRNSSGFIIQKSSVDGETAGTETAESSIEAIGPTDAVSDTFESLPAAIDHAFGHTTNVTVTSGTYSYSKPVFLPAQSHLHFQNAILEPSGCHGIRTGVREESRTSQMLTGRIDVRPRNGETPAKTCLFVTGSKLLQIRGSMTLRENGPRPSMLVSGGNDGTWWNSYEGLYVMGTYKQTSFGDVNPNAQNFTNCLFRGQFDVEAGNSLTCSHCWWEGISDGETIELNTGSVALHGRFEGVVLNINTGRNVGIDVQHETDLQINNNAPPDGTVSIRRENFSRYRSSNRDDRPVSNITQRGTYDEADRAVVELRHTEDDNGRSNLLRAVSGRPSGYYFRGDDGEEVDKVIEVKGDYRNESAGSGLVLTTPDGSAKYRIHIDNDGNVHSHLVRENS